MADDTLNILLFRHNRHFNPYTDALEYGIIRIDWNTPEFRLITICVRNALAILQHERAREILTYQALHSRDFFYRNDSNKHLKDVDEIRQFNAAEWIEQYFFRRIRLEFPAILIDDEMCERGDSTHFACCHRTYVDDNSYWAKGVWIALNGLKINSMVADAEKFKKPEDCRINLVEYSITIAHELAHTLTQYVTKVQARTPTLLSIDAGYNRQTYREDYRGQLIPKGESGDFFEIKALGGLIVNAPEHKDDPEAKSGLNIIRLTKPQGEHHCYKVSESCLDMLLAGTPILPLALNPNQKGWPSDSYKWQPKWGLNHPPYKPAPLPKLNNQPHEVYYSSIPQITRDGGGIYQSIRVKFDVDIRILNFTSRTNTLGPATANCHTASSYYDPRVHPILAYYPRQSSTFTAQDTAGKVPILLETCETHLSEPRNSGFWKDDPSWYQERLQKIRVLPPIESQPSPFWDWNGNDAGTFHQMNDDNEKPKDTRHKSWANNAGKQSPPQGSTDVPNVDSEQPPTMNQEATKTYDTGGSKKDAQVESTKGKRNEEEHMVSVHKKNLRSDDGNQMEQKKGKSGALDSSSGQPRSRTPAVAATSGKNKGKKRGEWASLRQGHFRE